MSGLGMVLGDACNRLRAGISPLGALQLEHGVERHLAIGPHRTRHPGALGSTWAEKWSWHAACTL